MDLFDEDGDDIYLLSAAAIVFYEVHHHALSLMQESPNSDGDAFGKSDVANVGN